MGKMRSVMRRSDEGTGSTPAFIPEGAFVVQFKTGSGTLNGQLAGRAEHVVSGQATHFDSPGELLAFLRAVLHRNLPEAPGMEGEADPTDIRRRR